MLISYLVFFKNPFKQLKMSEHDPPSSAQNVLRCQFCENLVLFMYCDICHMQLCKAWGGGIFPIIPKNIKKSHLNSRDLQLNVRNIPQIYVSFTAKTAKFQFACSALLPRNIMVIHWLK